MIHDALTFPFRGIGRYMLIIGGVLSLVISLAAFVPFLGLIIAIGASGYFAAYSFRIINTIPAIQRCFDKYVVLVAILGALTILNILVKRAFSGIPIAGWFLSFFLGMYALMVSARILGLFYREKSRIFNV